MNKENPGLSFRNAKGQVIGTLTDSVYRKKVRKTTHLFRMFDAWGIDKKTIRDLVSLGCKEVRIADIEEKRVYIAPLSAYKEHGIERNFDTPQIFLPRKHFDNPEGSPIT